MGACAVGIGAAGAMEICADAGRAVVRDTDAARTDFAPGRALRETRLREEIEVFIMLLHRMLLQGMLLHRKHIPEIEISKLRG